MWLLKKCSKVPRGTRGKGCKLGVSDTCLASDRDSMLTRFFFSYSVASDFLQPHELEPARLLSLSDFPGKNTGMGCRFLLQGIFLTQEWSMHFLLWQTDSFTPEPPGKPAIGTGNSKVPFIHYSPLDLPHLASPLYSAAKHSNQI